MKKDVLLGEYIRSGRLKGGNLPTPNFCAGLLHLSPCYFSDLLKFETGKTLSEYFQQKRIETARKMLLDQDTTVSMVAEQLGFPNLRYFSCLFKKITGISPENYKTVN